MTRRSSTARNASARRTPEPAEAADTRPALFPSLEDLADPRAPFLIPFVLLLLGHAITWFLIPAPAEDAYITFRYARHLASGLGLVYNPGERVMGFSSPLWTAWCALGFAIVREPIGWARMSALLCDVLTLLLAGRMLMRDGSRAAAWCFNFFFSVWPYFAAVAVSGMESSLLVALIVLGAAASAGRRPIAGPILGLVALTRPEGLVSALVLSLRATWRDRIVAAVIVAAGLAALGLYFGTVVPSSVTAKASTYGTPGPWINRHWWEWLSPVVAGRWPRVGDTSLLLAMLLVLPPAFAVGVARLWSMRGSATAIAAAAMLVVWLGYAVLGVAYFWWYFAVPLVGVTIAASIGFPTIVKGRAIPIATALFVLSIWSISWNLYVGRTNTEVTTFGAVARELRSRVHPGERVMLEPIGIIGFTVPVVVIDEVGLVSPRVARRRSQGPGWYSDVVASDRPQWLVVRQGMLATGEAFAGLGAPFRSLAERDSVLSRYEEVWRGDPAGGASTLVVLRRIGS